MKADLSGTKLKVRLRTPRALPDTKKRSSRFPRDVTKSLNGTHSDFVSVLIVEVLRGGRS